MLIVNLRLSILKPLKPTKDIPISIVIAARNEAENLINFLPSVLNQEYATFEVIVVNDRSIDDTADVLRAFEQKYDHLKVTVIQESEKFNFNKKFALTIGIKAAIYNHLLFTDADCKPVSNQWLKNMAIGFTPNKSIVVGYGGYIKTRGVLNKIIRSETHLIAQQYFGLGKLGVPYMAVGRNLAYSKNLFFSNKGFSNHLFLASGDDDLFMNENANRKNTEYVFNEDSYTCSVPKSTWKAYLEQKRRHLTTGSKYSLLSKSVLGLLSLINYSYYAITLGCLIVPDVHLMALGSIILVILCHMAVSYRSLKTINSLDLLFWVFVADIFILLFYPFAFVYNYFASGSIWKNY